MKKHQISKKGTSELQKGKKKAGYSNPNMFYELFRQNRFFMIFWKINMYQKPSFQLNDSFSNYLDNWETFDRKLLLRNGWTTKGDQPYF